MEANYLLVVFWSLAGGVLSLAGGLALIGNKKLAKTLSIYAMPFAAGALLGAAFFELIPESFEQLTSYYGAKWAIAGLLFFFILEHLIHWFHHDHHHGADKHNPATAPLIVIGDSVHNFIDGVAIGAAFLVSVPAGIVTAIAVASHEIPQEIGDFGVLLKSGLSRKRVVIINVLSSLMSTIGAVITFWAGSRVDLPVPALLAITAGMFIYIASSDLIPAIHHGELNKKPAYIAISLVLAGVLIVGAATELAHAYLDKHDAGHSHSLEHGHDSSQKTEIVSHDYLPTIKIDLHKDSIKGYNLHIMTTNFKFEADSIGSESRLGVGHAHVYVNGEKVTRVYGSEHYLEDVVTGDVVEVTLNANDHSVYTHEGLAIEAQAVAGNESHDEHDHEDDHSEEHDH